MIVSSLPKKKSIYRCDIVLDCIAYVCAKSLQPCPAVCDPMDCSPPGSSDNGILQARILEWVAMPSSRAPAWPRNLTHISSVFCIGWHVFFFFTTSTIWKPTMLHCAPPSPLPSMSKSYPLVPVNMALLGKRLFTEAVKCW